MKCKECPVEFSPSMSTQVFCSRKCNKRYHGRLERSRLPKRPVVFTSESATCIGCPTSLPVPRHPSRLKCDRCQKYGTPAKRRRQWAKRDSRRRAQDPAYVLRERLSCRLRELCSKRGLQKSNSITAYLGCSPQDLISILESKFLPGMSWQNYGVHGWHVDHHIPCAVFDLSREDHRSVCFHHSNLRPLWASLNSHKQAALHADIPPSLKAACLSIGLLIL